MVETPPEVKMAEEMKAATPTPRDITPDKVVWKMDTQPTKKMSEETVVKRRKRGIVEDEEPNRLERR